MESTGVFTDKDKAAAHLKVPLKLHLIHDFLSSPFASYIMFCLISGNISLRLSVLLLTQNCFEIHFLRSFFIAMEYHRTTIFMA